MLRTAAEPHLVVQGPTRALLDAVAADPHTTPSVAIQAPGGYGKTAILHELRRIYRQAGVIVVDAWQDMTESVDPTGVLVVDDAHLLDESRLRDLAQVLRNRELRLVVAYRPWPRPAGLVELTDLLKRDQPPLLLTPFTEDRTAACLAAIHDVKPQSATVRFVQTQTGGVPGHVERLSRVLSSPEVGRSAGVRNDAPPEVPDSVILQFGPEFDDLTPEVRQLLLAAAAGVDLPIDLLSGLMGAVTPEEIAEIQAAARATGLLGPDDHLSPIVRRAVTSLSPPAQRTAVWQRLAELQLQRGGPVLPLVRSLLGAGIGGGCPAPTLEAAAEEALTDEPALAAQLFAAAAAAGRPTGGRRALAAALSGDLDSALRLADQLVAAVDSPDRADGATVAATALAHRGQLDRSAELYRWAGTPSALAFAAVGSVGTGRAADLDRLLQAPPADGPPTLLASATLLTARGVRETLSGSPTAALSALVQASALLEPAGRTVLLPDSPAALAALVAVHCGELDIGERVLDRAVNARLGAALMYRRHRLLQAWILMVRGRTAAAEQVAASAIGAAPGTGLDTGDTGLLESRDLLFATALEMGIARRNSDLSALQRGWERAREAVVRHPVDLFTLLPLGELAIAGARLGDLGRLDPYLREASLLLERLGSPPLWTTPLHWSGLHAAILAEQPAVADEHVAALTAAAGHTRYGAAVAAAAQSWVEVLRGIVDPVKVEATARGLYDTGLGWDAARLAGQAAIRTSDRRAMTALLDCARLLQGRPAGHKNGPSTGGTTGQVADAVTVPPQSRLSDREQEVADLVLAGLTYKQIGDRLFISAKTVEHHVARMRQRLNCANRAELLARLRSMATERPGGEPVAATWPRRAST